MKKLKLSTLKDKTFKEGFEEFIFNCKARGLREATIHHYKESYAQIIRYMDKDMEIKDIDKEVFERFIVRARENKEIGSQTLFYFYSGLVAVPKHILGITDT